MSTADRAASKVPSVIGVVQRPVGERPDPVEQTRHREHVRNDVVGSGVTSLVVTPGAFEELHQPGIVHGRDRRGAELDRLDEGEPVVGEQRVTDRVGTARMLERRLQS
jgi:hypothetical protein